MITVEDYIKKMHYELLPINQYHNSMPQQQTLQLFKTLIGKKKKNINKKEEFQQGCLVDMRHELCEQ